VEDITFLITDRFGSSYGNTKNTVILTWDDWNDYSYYTAFGIEFRDSEGKKIEIGSVRIAYVGQKEGSQYKKLKVNDKFLKLEENYFSLGSDDSYYSNLTELGDDLRDHILTALRDIAFDPEIYDMAFEEDVTHSSLFRNISPDTVVGQYRRIAKGGARLTNYSFSYRFAQDEIKTSPSKIDFHVIAEHEPPTNIQIIIGRNGVGKSHLLNAMINSILEVSSREQTGKFVFNRPNRDQSFSNLICVSFSAFDEYDFHSKGRDKYSKIKYHYIGIKSLEKIKNDKATSIERDFGDDLTSSLGLIIASSKKTRWKETIRLLNSDPIFHDENFLEIIDQYDAENLLPIREKFSRLSSGHKIIILTVTRLVELSQEKSLIFFDEPETHLHPPLLSSFMRAIQALLINRNAVCIMSTHSPIVLQEVPRSCVFKLSRKGNLAKFENLKIESFGENISVLTNDIFGLEVTESGFYNILNDLAKENHSYQRAMSSIDGELGVEGRAILRSLFFNKGNQ